jgi:ribosome maturation factor RimP
VNDSKDKIRILAEQQLQDTDYFVVEVKLLPANKVQVFLDSDTVVTIDACAKISRHIEKTLDEEQWLGEKYILEVSSAGMDNPIKLVRQYIKHTGKLIEITTTTGEHIEGRIVSCDNETVTIAKEKTVKAKTTLLGEVLVPFTTIKQAKRILNF